MRAHVVQHVLHGPFTFDGDVVGRHQPADGVLAVAQQRLRHALLLGRQQRHQALHYLARQLFKQRRAVVGRHVVQHGRGVDVAQAGQQLLLRLQIEILERFRRLMRVEHGEQPAALLGVELAEQAGQIGGEPTVQYVVQRIEVPFGDQFPNLGQGEFAKHVSKPFTADKGTDAVTLGASSRK